jgi:signal transduction histidine kinase/sensor domain CHASE-containing protein/CheY-like chemotaxis protein
VTLRRTTLLIIGAALLGLLATFFAITRLTLMPRFARLEDTQTRAQVTRAYTALKSELAELGTIAHDDGEWDEAYEFVQHPTRAFLESNFSPTFFNEMRVDLVEYLDLEGHTRYQYLSLPGRSDHSIPPEIQQKLLQPGVLVGVAEPDKVSDGILMLPTGPMLVASLAVRRSSRLVPPRGSLIIGRRLDANEVHRLCLLTALNLQLYRVDDPNLPPDVQEVRGSLNRLTPIFTRPLNERSIRGYELINDIAGDPALILAASMPRKVYAEGRNAEVFVVVSALLVGVAFSLLTVLLLEKLVLARLVRLGRRVAAVGTRGDLSARVGSEGKDEIGQLAGVINRMLGDLAEAERSRRRQEERYRAFITQSSEGIWRCELAAPMPMDLPPEQQIAHLRQHLYLAECNDALARLYGLDSSDQLTGLAIRDSRFAADPRNRDLIMRIMRAGYRMTDGESVVAGREGHTRYFLNNVTGVIDDGKLVRIWGTQREVTEQRRLEQQLRQAQKMEAVGRLAGGVAHDFNNLLSVIHGYTELLLRRFYPGSPEQKEAQQVLHATDRAAALTRQLLALGRKQVLAPRILDLNAVAFDIYMLLRRLVREDVEFETRFAPQLWSVRADPTQMEQVLVNLIANASDATPAGATVTLETRNVTLRASSPGGDSWLPPGEYVQLMVSDNGVGMDAETRARIFEPFFSTKEVGKGTGLGLATVYGIVRQSGGQISVQSEPGSGSAFTVYLPRAYGAPEPLKEEPEVRAVPRRSGTLLLVEDDASVRELTYQVLHGRGYTVLTAASGAEALAIASTHAAEIELLITDVIMPGMTGDELVAKMRRCRPELGVVFVSGYASDAIPNIVSDGRTAFLQKPFPVEDLVRKVYDMLEALTPQEKSR